MTSSLIGRTLYEKRWFLIGWALAFGVMSTLIMMFYPSFSDGGGFGAVAKSLPSQLQGFIGDPSVFGTIDGFITLQIFDVRMSLMLIIMTMVLASGLTVREEETGDLRTTLMTSLSRNRVIFEKFIAALVIIAILNAVSILGVYVGIISIGEAIPHELLWKLYGLSCVFAMTAFSIPFAIGLATGKRGVTMTIGLCVALGSYLLSTFSRAVDWLKDWDVLSLIHYFDTAGVRENDFSLVNIWVFCLITLLALAIAMLLFRSRDVA